MSHNVKLKDVVFTDIKVVRAAVEELRRDGAKVTLIEGENAHMRGWAGAKTKCDAVIQIDGGPWDVGLNWNEKEKKFDVITESMLHSGNSGGLGALPTSKTLDGKACNIRDGALGRLTQKYNIIRDEQVAGRLGYMTKRIAGKDGVMMLEATKL